MHSNRPPEAALLALAALLTLGACTSPTSSPAPVDASAVPAGPTPGASTPGATVLPASTAPIAVVTDGVGDPRPAPDLADLVNADGSVFDLASYAGIPTLLFFGYTHCPDVCPATIGEIFGVFEAAPETRAVFVSVDPERDTPEFLAEWTQYFPDNFDAVTGSPGAIRRAADAYGVRYARVETTSTAGYTMSHTADLFLIDADGQLRLTYPFGTPASTIVADLSRLETG